MEDREKRWGYDETGRLFQRKENAVKKRENYTCLGPFSQEHLEVNPSKIKPFYKRLGGFTST